MTKLTKAARDALPVADFAEPDIRAYPIEDKAHARDAKARASAAVHTGRMTQAEADRIDRLADAVLAKPNVP
ncbi:hypothetical protein EUV02_02270 [Polymorphobacter arshaanensis]|uniref:Uncharacterized protein n=1 Tax=Glacieibacterium arshaanense TaxID=2511025 RepID=A0A4Y9ER06_9SPHN|nr:hypothetical protein [Polymorphobacter arshaanensis]TFU05872.1 hypothetical protein EUV02_02270 [Polymorphobacter arshaanensis]